MLENKVDFKRLSQHNVGKKVEYKGNTYDSKTAAYIALASKHSIEELCSILNCEPSYVHVLKRNTGVNFKDAVIKGVRRVVIDSIPFKNMTVAFKALAPKYTKEELAELFEVTESYINKLSNRTSVQYKA